MRNEKEKVMKMKLFHVKRFMEKMKEEKKKEFQLECRRNRKIKMEGGEQYEGETKWHFSHDY